MGWSLPFVILGFFFFSWAPLILGLIAAAVGLALLALAMASEAVIAGLERAVLPGALPGMGGLEASIKRVRELLPQKIRRVPLKIRVIPDSAPHALLIQALGSPFSLFISQGWLSRAKEPEIRALFKDVLVEISEPWAGRRFATLCAALSAILMAVIPFSWMATVYGGLVHTPRPLPPSASVSRLSPFGALRFFLLFPWIEFSLRFGRLPWAPELPASSLSKASGDWGRSARPALVNLYL